MGMIPIRERWYAEFNPRSTMHSALLLSSGFAEAALRGDDPPAALRLGHQASYLLTVQ